MIKVTVLGVRQLIENNRTYDNKICELEFENMESAASFMEFWDRSAVKQDGVIAYKYAVEFVESEEN